MPNKEASIVDRISGELIAIGHLPADHEETFKNDLKKDIERAVIRYRQGLASSVVHSLIIARLAA